MYKILTNIASVREEVNDHDVNIWKLPRLIAATNLSLGVQGDSLEDALIKQKVQDENDEGFWTSIGLAAAQVGLVLLAPVTGGLTLIPAAAISAARWSRVSESTVSRAHSPARISIVRSRLPRKNRRCSGWRWTSSCSFPTLSLH
jgi:hypothetical protein